MLVRCLIGVCCLLALCGVVRAAEGDGALRDASSEHVRQLETLLAAGRFQEFTDAAIGSTTSDPQPAGLARLQVEALLSIGRNREAENLALRHLDPTLLKLWLTARWRQARGPDDPALDRWLKQQTADGSSAGSPASSPAVAALGFWREALAGAAPYRLRGPAHRSVLPMVAAEPPVGQLTTQKNSRTGVPDAIAIEINGLRLPQVFVDTGAQYTLLTPAAAAAAGVEIGPDCFAMVGFANFRARPAVVRQLRLGELVLRDVPVYVGQSPALARAGGQASLGIDLMHHLRLAMDYPRRQVIVEPAASVAGSREPAAEPTPAGWEIPLWTFSQTCLAQGRLPDGEFARTLIDTGNRQGTYLSSRWASQVGSAVRIERGQVGSAVRTGLDWSARNWPAQRTLLDWFVRRYRPGKTTLGRWELGNLQLTNWPVRGMLPAELERLDVVDLLVGHDLLSRYRVEIDLPGRRLLLSEPAIRF